MDFLEKRPLLLNTYPTPACQVHWLPHRKLQIRLHSFVCLFTAPPLWLWVIHCSYIKVRKRGLNERCWNSGDGCSDRAGNQPTLLLIDQYLNDQRRFLPLWLVLFQEIILDHHLSFPFRMYLWLLSQPTSGSSRWHTRIPPPFLSQQHYDVG